MPGSAFRPPSPPTLTSAGCRDRPAIYSGRPPRMTARRLLPELAKAGNPLPALESARLAWVLVAIGFSVLPCIASAIGLLGGVPLRVQPALLQSAAPVRENQEHQPERARGSPETSAGWALAGTGPVG